MVQHVRESHRSAASLLIPRDASQLMAHRSRVPIAHVDGEGFKLRYANPGFLRELGRRGDELTGAPLPELLVSEEVTNLLERGRTSRATEVMHDVPYESAFGPRRASFLVQPLLFADVVPDGLVVHLLGYPQRSEVSELKDKNEELLRTVVREQEAAERARRSAAELMGLVGNMAEGVTILDAAGDIVFLNRACREILGASDEEEPRRAYARCQLVDGHGQRLSFEGDLVPGLLAGESVRDRELVLVREDASSRRIVANGSAVRDGDGAIVLAITAFRDVSALHQLEETKQLYFALISHDLRGPLSAAAITAAALERHGGAPGKAKAYAQRIQRSLARMDQMLQDLLDAQRLRAGEKLELKLSSGDLAELAREVSAELGALHGDRFVLEGVRSLPGTWDVAEVRRALWNLGTNAVKHGAATKPIVITVEQAGARAYAHVRNEGPRIPHEARERLFAPFARGVGSTPSHGGWGLGLTLVRGCAEAHGGSVHVVSEETRGTTFTLELPVTTSPPP